MQGSVVSFSFFFSLGPVLSLPSFWLHFVSPVFLFIGKVGCKERCPFMYHGPRGKGRQRVLRVVAWTMGNTTPGGM